VPAVELDTSNPGISGNADGVISNDPYLMANKETIDEAIASVPNEYKQNYKCKEFANDFKTRLESQGISAEVIELKSPTENIVTANGKNISRNGEHQAIKIGDTVYDNNNPAGMNYDEWLEDLSVNDEIYGIEVKNQRF
jgi:hypothetical protein